MDGEVGAADSEFEEDASSKLPLLQRFYLKNI